MAATRLTDSQKNELVERFRAGESSQELADAFACSPNTVIRAVRSVLDPADYERLKQQRARRGVRPGEGLEAVVPSPAGGEEPPLQPAGHGREAVAAEDVEDAADEDDADDEEPGDVAAPAADPLPEAGQTLSLPREPRRSLPVRTRVVRGSEPFPRPSEDGPGVLAIDDADDFSGEEDDLLGEDEGGDEDGSAFMPIPLVLSVDDHALRAPEPLSSAPWPPSVYMLVDKTVELQARPLRDFPELGRLADGEEERQALAVFTNPRQAKRQCGRSQRVIKLPDPRVLERTAPYLIAQGISRVVVEGALYALPGS